MNCFDHDAAITQNIKGTMNALFGPHLKYIKRHGFPFHFMDNRYITGIFCFTYGQKAFATNR